MTGAVMTAVARETRVQSGTLRVIFRRALSFLRIALAARTGTELAALTADLPAGLTLAQLRLA
jgi:hypothetical protein